MSLICFLMYLINCLNIKFVICGIWECFTRTKVSAPTQDHFIETRCHSYVCLWMLYFGWILSSTSLTNVILIFWIIPQLFEYNICHLFHWLIGFSTTSRLLYCEKALLVSLLTAALLWLIFWSTFIINVIPELITRIVWLRHCFPSEACSSKQNFHYNYNKTSATCFLIDALLWLIL